MGTLRLDVPIGEPPYDPKSTLKSRLSECPRTHAWPPPRLGPIPHPPDYSTPQAVSQRAHEAAGYKFHDSNGYVCGCRVGLDGWAADAFYREVWRLAHAKTTDFAKLYRAFMVAVSRQKGEQR